MNHKSFGVAELFSSFSFFFRYFFVFAKLLIALWIGFDVIELYQENPMYRTMSVFLFWAVTIWFLLRQLGFNPRIRRGG